MSMKLKKKKLSIARVKQKGSTIVDLITFVKKLK